MHHCPPIFLDNRDVYCADFGHLIGSGNSVQFITDFADVFKEGQVVANVGRSSCVVNPYSMCIDRMSGCIMRRLKLNCDL